MSSSTQQKQPNRVHRTQQVGRYAIFGELAAGGMATVHLARLMGRQGFSRLVAAKRMHRRYLLDPALKRMFLEEARLAARVRHPNVVPILDVLSHEDEFIIVMEYVHGVSLANLSRLRAGSPFPIPIASAILSGALQGLHAAHEARSERGKLLGIVHRDVSPHNILVGQDGMVRMADFGVAKALHAGEETLPGLIKGKLSFMAPEVARGESATRRSDVFSAAVVFWELLTGRRLFSGRTERERVLALLSGDYPGVRSVNREVSPELESIVAKGLVVDPAKRHENALAFATAIEREVQVASQRVLSEWVQGLAAPELERRARLIQDIEAAETGPISAIRERAPSTDFEAVPASALEAPAPDTTRVRLSSASLAQKGRYRLARVSALGALPLLLFTTLTLVDPFGISNPARREVSGIIVPLSSKPTGNLEARGDEPSNREPSSTGSGGHIVAIGSLVHGQSASALEPTSSISAHQEPAHQEPAHQEPVSQKPRSPRTPRARVLSSSLAAKPSTDSTPRKTNPLKANPLKANPAPSRATPLITTPVKQFLPHQL